MIIPYFSILLLTAISKTSFKNNQSIVNNCNNYHTFSATAHDCFQSIVMFVKRRRKKSFAESRGGQLGNGINRFSVELLSIFSEFVVLQLSGVRLKGKFH